MITVFALSLLAGVLGSLVLPLLLRPAGFLDIPSARSSHAQPTPKGGGVGVVVAFTGAALFSGWPILWWLPILGVALVSFINDLRPLSPSLRLIAQFGFATLALWESGLTLHSPPELVIFLGALFFIAATANCYNFMDGINGLAGLTGVVAFGAVALFQMRRGESALAMPIIAVVGALCGFLPFNLFRARLFLGDVGSIFLGFFFALCVCIVAQSATDFFLLTSFLFPFYADEAVTVMERLWRRESLLKPHRRHLYQFLVNEHGLAHWKISVTYASLQTLIIVCMVTIAPAGPAAILGLELALLVAWTSFHFIVKKRIGAL